MRWLSIVIALVVLAGCGSSERPLPARPRTSAQLDAGPGEPEPERPSEPRLAVPEDDRAPDGRACTRTDECGRGLQCRGAPGCGSDWACGEPRECLDEVVAYCDCDGSTFYARGGCPGRPYAQVGPCGEMGELVAQGTELGIPDWDEQPTTQDRVCESSAGCARGLTCVGIAGCASEWRCVRARGCTRDRVPFCGCEGETFLASSTCPSRPFLHRGACRGEALAQANPRETAPHATAPGESAPRETAPRETAPRETAPHASAPRETASRETTRRETARREITPREEREPRGRDARTAPASAPPASSEEPAPARGEHVCRTTRDCPRGLVCQGPAGCGMEWTCGRPERRCVEDTQVFCDCEGEDFRASMFCPGRPYRHRGSCEIDRLLDLSGATVR